MSKIAITFGAMADPIGAQLYKQGIVINAAAADRIDRCADAVTLLAIHGYLTDAEKARARTRLMKAITREAGR